MFDWINRQTRGRRSKVHTLPSEIKKKLDKMLRDGTLSQKVILAEINEMCAAARVEGLSRSGLNRYSTHLETVGSKLREAQEISKVWVDEFGADSSNEVSQMVIQTLRTLALDTTFKQADSKEPIPPKHLKELAIAIEKLERAADITQKREIQLRKRVAEEAADAAETAAKAAGMTKAGAEAIKREILGIA